MQIVSQYLKKTFPYSPHYFSLWRIIFGWFLTYYSIAVFPYLELLYSNTGLYSVYEVLPFFPNILAVHDGALLVNTLGALAIVCSVCILLGYQRPLAAGLLWFITMCFFGRNVLTEDPSFSFVSLLLLLLMIVPEGEPLSLGRLWSSCREDWYMPYWIYHTILFAIGLGFSISGLDKLQGQGWVTGDAMFFLYNLQLAYDTWLVALLKQQPTWLIALQTWGAMFVMLIALPLLSLPRTRALMWLLLFSMFAFVLIILDLKQVVFGVLLALLFIFDARWIPGRRATHVELFYDTSCKLCEGYRKFIEAENELQTNVIPFSSISTLPKQYDLGSDSIVLIVEDSAYYRSDAILMQFRLLGGIWLLLSYVGVLVPKKLRDALYNFVARNRYRWFGRCGCEGPEIV